MGNNFCTQNKNNLNDLNLKSNSDQNTENKSKIYENVNKNIIERLKKTNPDSIPYFTFKNKILDAKCCSVYDGDTFTIIFMYNGEILKYKCRCYGYDSPEMKPLLSKENREEEIKLAHKAKDRFLELINKSPNGVIKIECLDFDKYGRILVNVYNYVDKDSVNDIMIKEGHGKPYFGGTKY
jgi:endonuclease YncB( thermonuclease family)